ncbi:MAG: excinuclease ABC subunit C, partial [Alistipes sp.]|nr:excinuclease ABC subunit C [Alistipes sp.]
ISLKEQVALLPMSAGCYLFENSKGEVIYVGKAKHLRNRVRSYFVESRDHSAKVRVMVRQIASMRHIVVDSETDALLLENSLIKTLQPRYNILLKDDKSYPWIAVTAEEFPRVLSTRQIVRDGSQYYGPYGSISAQRALLDFIREALPLRSCRTRMTEESISKGRHTACLQYHLGNCKAPCIGNCSREEYRSYVDIVTSVLKGDLRPVRTYLEGEMMRAAEELRFEVAARYKARLEALERYASRSVIVSAKMGDTDIFSLLVDDDEAYCNFLRVRNGSITAVHTATIAVGVESDEREIMTLGIQHIKENIAGELAREVLVSHLPHEELFEGVKFSIPQRGEKHDLLEFSLRSAKTTRAERLKNLEIHNPARHTDRLMEAMRRELRLQKEPRHIECFDNSNLQGTNPVASCVVFRDGKPSRKDYRLSIDEAHSINAAIEEKMQRVDKMVEKVAKLVSQATELPAISVAARRGGATVKRFELILAGAGSFILVIMLSTDEVVNKLIKLPVSVGESDLKLLSAVLNATMTELPAEEFTATLLERVMNSAGSAAMLVPVIVEFTTETLNRQQSTNMAVAGQVRLLNQPEYRDIDKAQRMLTNLDEDSLSNLPAVMQGTNGTKVLVGPENVSAELKDTSVVMTKFDIGDGLQGMIGVVGPTRMDYAKVT